MFLIQTMPLLQLLTEISLSDRKHSVKVPLTGDFFVVWIHLPYIFFPWIFQSVFFSYTHIFFVTSVTQTQPDFNSTRDTQLRPVDPRIRKDLYVRFFSSRNHGYTSSVLREMNMTKRDSVSPICYSNAITPGLFVYILISFIQDIANPHRYIGVQLLLFYILKRIITTLDCRRHTITMSLTPGFL